MPKVTHCAEPISPTEKPERTKDLAHAVPQPSRLNASSLMCGGVTIALALASRWASSFLAHDDFDFFFMIFLSESCLVWPTAFCSVVLGMLAGSSGCGWKQPIVGIVLSCLGLVIVVLEWIA